MAGMWLVGEDLPQETNRVTLDPTAKDEHGMPVAVVHLTTIPTTSPCATMPTGKGRRSTNRSARRACSRRRPIPSTHNMGTNRMSEKPRDGVVNKYGQTHDIKNLFVSDGSQFTTSAA